MPHVSFHTLVTTNFFPCLTRVEIYFRFGEIRRIKRVYRAIVIFPRIALWQQERLRGAALLVDRHEIETRVKAVAPAAGEHHPVGIDVPVVIAVGTVAVGLGQRARLTRLQVEQPLVALVVPHREIAIVLQGEKQVTAIVGGARPREALAHLHGIEERVDLVAEAARLCIEGNAAQVVLFFLEVGGVFALQTGHVVQPTAVGREDG